MKIWLSKNSEIPIKEQLIAQVRIGVACGDLTPGDKLPSTRDLARRFGVHPNTISAAFQELASTGEVSNKKGSGVFVNSTGDFTDQPKVANGASELMQDVFGEAGRHARAAVGVPALPLGVAVEVDAIVEVRD